MYSRLLFSTDLGPQSLYIGQRAFRLSQICEAELHILHVIEPPVTYTTNFSEREKILKKAQDVAKASLSALSVQLGLKESQQIISVGSPQNEILDIAFKGQMDLIIVGSHGIGGYTHALGSTAHYILSEAYCDVLIIQVSHLQEGIANEPPLKGEYLWQNRAISSTSATAKPGSPIGTLKYGSEKGFGEEVRRGPRPTIRPSNSPYKGGTRSRTSEDEEQEDKKDD